MSKIKGVLLDGVKSQVVEIENTLDNLYKLLDCDCINITKRHVYGRDYWFVCDDEGLLKDNVITSLYVKKDGHFNIAFVGKIFVVGYDGYEDIKSLSHAEIVHLLFFCKDGILLIGE